MNRGKRGLDDLLELEGSDPLLMVGEYHGNPSSLSIYNEGMETLSVWITVTAPSEKLPRDLPKPSIVGTNRLSKLLSSALLLPVNDCSPSCLNVSDDSIGFYGKDILLFKFKIKSFKECDNEQ